MYEQEHAVNCNECGELFMIEDLADGLLCNLCFMQDEYDNKTGDKDDVYESGKTSIYG